MSRIHYPECVVEVGPLDGRPAFECDDAEVWLEEESILISYFDDEGIVVLEGFPRESGGWELAARSRPRRAFLSPMPEAQAVLAGEIDEQGETTSWKLVLGTPESN